MKGVKILGLVESVSSKLRSLRSKEVNQAKRVRIFYAIFTLLQTLSLSGTRWVTYTTYGIITLVSSRGKNGGLDVSLLFTSLAILNIFMERLEIFLRQMPSIASSFGCLRRIEVFLLLETKRDSRLVEDIETAEGEVAGEYELHDMRSGKEVISMKDLSVGWTKEQAIIQGLNIDFPQGSMTMVVGP
jgi:ATP-binding cassette subfamily C (CFTR/MRP) protein 1